MAYIAPLVLNQDPKLKRQVCCALAQIAKHSVDMAEVVMEAEVFPKILTCLKFPDELVRKHAATVVREVCIWRLLLTVCYMCLSMLPLLEAHLSPVTVLQICISPEFQSSIDVVLRACMQH